MMSYLMKMNKVAAVQPESAEFVDKDARFNSSNSSGCVLRKV